MKNTLKILFSFIFFFCISTTGFAATYYVSSTNGSDRNPGSQFAPWARCPGMAGWSGSAKLRAGDTVYFNSAGTWSASSGRALLFVVGGVTYDGSTWGNGQRATLLAKGNFSHSVLGVMDDHPTIETTIKGFHININNKSTNGIGVGWPGIGANLTGATKRIENCISHNVNPNTKSYALKVGAVNNYETHNVEIIKCVIYNTPRTGIGIYAGYQSSKNKIVNTTVKGCEVYNTGLDKTAGGYGIMLKDNIQNCIVENNFIHDTNGRGIDIENHPGITGPSNAIIRHNIITNCNKGGIYISQPGSKSAYIYGNLIFHNKGNGSGGSGLYFEGNLSGNIAAKIYNNTFYENTSGEVIIARSPAQFNGTELINNIFIANDNKYIYNDLNSNSTIQHSNNLYYKSFYNNLVKIGSKIYSMNNILSFDENALLSKPMFKNPSNLPNGFIENGKSLIPNKDGLSILTNSPAKNNGLNLGLKFETSINNIIRNSRGTWDLGAYEFTEPLQELLSPKNLKIVKN